MVLRYLIIFTFHAHSNIKVRFKVEQ